MNRPITIAGGGLAGLALGVALRRSDVPVRVIEASNYPRHRVCGEYLSGIQPQELAALGITDLLQPAVRHHDTAWFDGPRLLLRQSIPEDAYGISRHYLDEALATRFRDLGGDLQTSTRFTDNEQAEGTVLAMGRPQRASAWLGLKAHYTDLPLTSDLEVHLSNAAYVGLARVEGGAVNVCGLFGRTDAIASAGLRALERACVDAGLSGLAERLQAASLDAASLKGVNRFHLGWQPVQDQAVRVGDAAAIIPPFTGNGMTMAFQSALCALPPLIAWSTGGTPWSTTAALIRTAQQQRFAARLRWTRWLQTLLMHPLGRRASAAVVRSGLVSFATLYRKVR